MQLPEITHAQEIQIQNAPKVATAIPDSLLRRLETTPAALERMKSDDLWTNTTVNAAGAVLDQTRRYAEVGLGYAISDGDFNRPQGGRYRSDLLFNTEGGRECRQILYVGSLRLYAVENQRRLVQLVR